MVHIIGSSISAVVRLKSGPENRNRLAPARTAGDNYEVASQRKQFQKFDKNLGLFYAINNKHANDFWSRRKGAGEEMLLGS